MQIAENLFHYSQLITERYQSEKFTPVWTFQSARDFINILKDCATEGLDPENYHYSKLLYYSQKIRTVEESLDFEGWLTDAFLLYAEDLMYGTVDPATVHPYYTSEFRSFNPNRLLQELTASPSVSQLVHRLRPNFASYARLMTKVAEYQEIARHGGWDSLEYLSSFEPGDSHEQIGQIKQRLWVTGDFPNDTSAPHVFDEKLRLAVVRFQQRHGLEADGKIGKSTILAMNIPAEDRIAEMQVTLEQMRWLPNDPGVYYVLVNIPAYQMTVVKNDSTELKMDIAVGKTYRKTPVFNSVIDHLVINPYWRVPPTILKNDLLPEQIKNNDYLKRKNIEVVDYETGAVLDLETIQWDSINTQRFPYQLRQNPGKDNALGTVKFSFANPFNIYMHDTNNHAIFSKTNRALSSGCIRLSQPMEFAIYLLHTGEGWDEGRLKKIMSVKQDYAIQIAEKPNLYIHYWTAFVDENGVLNFRPDIYEVNELIRDQMNSHQTTTASSMLTSL